MVETHENLFLGSSWIYYKIYTGPKTSDTILTDFIYPIITKLLNARIIDKWFFIRYSDPKYHLRIRFHLNDKKDSGKVINKLYPVLDNLINNEMIWKVQTDTYQRELNRYGNKTIHFAESLFFYDSEIIVNALKSMQKIDNSDEARWLFGLQAINELLDNFEYSLDGKVDLLRVLKNGFAEEFGQSKGLKRQLDYKYRLGQKKIEFYLENKATENINSDPILSILYSRRNDIKNTIFQIFKHKDEEMLEVELDNLIKSFIHMLMNRLFRSKNRIYELVIYHFLHKYYNSLLIRNSQTMGTLK